jgi:hypothetical protein
MFIESFLAQWIAIDGHVLYAFGVQKDFLIPFKAKSYAGMGGGTQSASYS